MHIGVIVEGAGEERAFPILFRRIADGLGVFQYELHKPFRIPRSAFYFRDGTPVTDQLAKAVLYLSRKPHLDRILMLADADKDETCKLAPTVVRHAESVASHVRHSVVLPMREYEAWFLAAAASLRGIRGIREDAMYMGDPEGVLDAKGALQGLMDSGRYYSPTTDQPALTAVMNLDEARATYSFRKLERECQKLLSM